MEEVGRTAEWSGGGASGSDANGNGDKTTPTVAAGCGAVAGGHIIMQQPVPAASRRPETEDGADKGKRDSDDGFPEGVPADGGVSMRAPGFSSFAEEVCFSHPHARAMLYATPHPKIAGSN